jgi:hypothetical protein
MHLNSWLMLISWPLIILICWHVIRFAVKIYERKYNETSEN